MWPCYVLVAEKLASWTEVTTVMTIDDVEFLLVATNVIAEHSEMLAKRKAQQKGGGR